MSVGAALALPEDVARHAVRVLRMRTGDPLVLFDGTGGEYRARLQRDGDRARALVEAHEPVDRESPLAITLVQGVASSDRMDFVVQKAVELGVRAIAPVFTARGVPRFDARKAERRHEHWRQVAISACEQCGRNRVPDVAEAAELAHWLRREHAPARRLILSTRGGDPLAANVSFGEDVVLLVGPEGGFTPDEHAAAVRRQFVPVTLGPRILRTETAGCAALAVLQAVAGDLR
jgi:16S rRNA (uracil1498-N3)-methyltransferase